MAVKVMAVCKAASFEGKREPVRQTTSHVIACLSRNLSVPDVWHASPWAREGTLLPCSYRRGSMTYNHQ